MAADKLVIFAQARRPLWGTVSDLFAITGPGTVVVGTEKHLTAGSRLVVDRLKSVW